MLRCTGIIIMTRRTCCATQHIASTALAVWQTCVLGAGRWPTLNVTHAAGASFLREVGAQGPPRLLAVVVFFVAVDRAALAATGGTVTWGTLVHNPQEAAQPGNKLSTAMPPIQMLSDALHHTHRTDTPA